VLKPPPSPEVKDEASDQKEIRGKNTCTGQSIRKSFGRLKV